FLHRLDRFEAIDDRSCSVPKAIQHHFDENAVRFIVLDHQNLEVPSRWTRHQMLGGRIVLRFRRADSTGQLKTEATAGAEFAARPNFSTHQFDKLLGNGKAESRPAETPADRAVRLTEGLE